MSKTLFSRGRSYIT